MTRNTNKNHQNLIFKFNFSVSKIISIFVIFFLLKEYQIRRATFISNIFVKFNLCNTLFSENEPYFCRTKSNKKPFDYVHQLQETSWLFIVIVVPALVRYGRKTDFTGQQIQMPCIEDPESHHHQQKLRFSLPCTPLAVRWAPSRNIV